MEKHTVTAQNNINLSTNLQKLQYIKKFLKSWQSLKEDEVEFKRLGGLSNLVWEVRTIRSDIQPTAIIFRQFGESDELLDRQKEMHVFKELSKTGLGPKLYGGDDNYRLEEFFEGRCPNSNEIKSNTILRRKLATHLSKIHSTRVEKLEKSPLMLQILEDGYMLTVFEEKASKDIFTLKEQQKLDEIMKLSGPNEVDLLLQVLPKNQKSVVFSHNDLHSQNVLIDKSQKCILIDFEYSSYNYQGYDIANIFNEAIIDYEVETPPYYSIDESKYPSEEIIRDFIRYYVFEKMVDKNLEYDKKQLLENENYFKDIVDDVIGKEKFESSVENVYQEVMVCRLLSHYYWCLWSVIMSKQQGIKFDYISYAYDRFKIYQRLKAEYLKKIKKIIQIDEEDDDDDY